MLIGTHNFSDLLEMAEEGDNTKVDIVPGDYQQLEKSYPNLGDAPVLISLGKLGQDTTSKEDIAKGLFLMVAYNLAQISLMHSNVHKIDRIVFTGFFCRNNTFMIDCFEQAFSFFQKEQHSANIKHAYGLRHDGYLGVLGALYTLLKIK
jgi:type II pantothenate kinase